MQYKRILTIQDISCLGQCSLTVALPVLSACSVETCVIPSAVLSTHTGGFSGYTFRDLTDDIPKIQKHWQAENIKFDAVYTGYLGSTRQIDYIKDIFLAFESDGCLKIVDPAMADNGRLYKGFDSEYAAEMKSLCREADIIIPNVTEACLIASVEYRESYDEDYIVRLLHSLSSEGMKTVVLTGVGYSDEKTGVVVFENSEISYYEHERICDGCHGTGDVYASAFTGALMNGKSIFEAAKTAADFTVLCIKNTVGDSSHWYGVKFEPCLAELIRAVSH